MKNEHEYVKHEIISLKDNPNFNEIWLHKKIQEDPLILGLGDLEVKDIERKQPKAGRLDLLLKDPESGKRYVVEIMLGELDESHIIRTIEYWDIERKRYPNYEHCAVIIAEKINQRFLNVLNLFNQYIPLIAIQLNALKIENKILLHPTIVLDEIVRGTDEEDEGYGKPVDRKYWEDRTPKQSLDVVDECLKILQEINSGLDFKYNKYYIGLTEGQSINNFVVFRPKKHWIRCTARINNIDTWGSKLEEAGVAVLESGKSKGKLTFNIAEKDVKKSRDLLKALFSSSSKEWM